MFSKSTQNHGSATLKSKLKFFRLDKVSINCYVPSKWLVELRRYVEIFRQIVCPNFLKHKEMFSKSTQNHGSAALKSKLKFFRLDKVSINFYVPSKWLVEGM